MLNYGSYPWLGIWGLAIEDNTGTSKLIEWGYVEKFIKGDRMADAMEIE